MKTESPYELNNKQSILEASIWESERLKLEEQLSNHRKKCRHWSMKYNGTVPNRDPQFPADEIYVCEFCGYVDKR